MSAARILVVEDEAIIAYDLERTLQRLGYDVPEVVAEGEAAIEAAARHAPSLVLMDIKLRGALDGVDAARAIRERLEMPVVFLTSHSDLATLSRAAAAQPQGYVMKPFVERDLHVAIEVAIRKHEVERALRHRERWFSTTLQCVGDGVVATDEGMAVSYLNRAAEARGATQREQKVRRSGYGAYGSASSLKESLFELGFISKESLREHQYHQYNVDAAAAMFAESASSFRLSLLSNAAILVIGALAGIAAMVFVARGVTKPIERMTRVMVRLARNEFDVEIAYLDR